jgi:hypothetical protein
MKCILDGKLISKFLFKLVDFNLLADNILQKKTLNDSILKKHNETKTFEKLTSKINKPNLGQRTPYKCLLA